MSAVSSEVPFSLPKLLRLWIITVVFSPIMSGQNWEQLRNPKAKTELTSAPAFDDILIREIDATVGQTLLLPCTVRNLGNKVVSWIRSKDLHILTSERHPFSSDRRFEPVHSDSSGDFWGLRIRGVQLSDTGQYECQVNTEPKMSLAMQLSVKDDRKSGVADSKWVSQALIKGPGTVYVQDGSPATFHCEISPMQSRLFLSGKPGKPMVRWLHDDKDVVFEFRKDNITVDTEYRDKDQRIFSKIHLPAVSWKDSGQYTCMQPSTKPDSVRLIVIEGEHSEAMQRDDPVQSAGNQISTGKCVSISLFYFLSVYSTFVNALALL